MKRSDIINHLIKLYEYKSYLEIGVRKPKHNFIKINIEDKDGVDPNVNCNFKMTSDEFFKTNKKNYDIIFIDGLHVDEQVTRDVINSLEFLNPNGTIVIHDCNPKEEVHQFEKYDKSVRIWNGTVWKAFAKLRSTRPDLYMKVVDTDHGVGIVRIGSQELFNLDGMKLDFSFLEENRVELLNLISIEEFINEFQLKRVA